MQSEEQKTFVLELSANRERLQAKIEGILHGFVEQIVEKKPLAIEAGDGHCDKPALVPKSEAGVQTDETPLPSKSVEPSVSSGTSAGSPELALRPLPQGEEALRLEVAALTVKLIEKRSRVSSLEQASVDLRNSINLLVQEQEKLTIALRLAEAEILGVRQTEHQLTADYKRAADEVQKLRAAIADFHKPGNRLYDSVKDAVERRMRGEPPLTPPIFSRSQKRPETEADPNRRPHKRPRISSLDAGTYQMPAVNPQPQPPHGPSQTSAPRHEHPTLTSNGDNRMRLVQSAPGPPPQGRPPDQMYMQPTQSAPGSSHPSHHRPIEIRSTSGNQLTTQPHSRPQPPRSNTIPTPSPAQLSAIAQDNANNSFVNNPFTHSISTHGPSSRPQQQRPDSGHNRSRSGTNGVPNGSFPSSNTPANPSGAFSVPSSTPVPYQPLPPPPEPVLYVNPHTNEFVWAHPGQKVPIAPPNNSSRPPLLPAANSSSVGSTRDQPIVLTPPNGTPTQLHFPNIALARSEGGVPRSSPQNHQRPLQNAIHPQPTVPSQASQAPPPTNQSFDRQTLDLLAMQSAITTSNWVNTVTDINTGEARTIAEAVFPVLYAIDSTNVTVCKVCGGKAEKRDFNTMFFHLFTRHKTEYDAVLSVIKGGKATT